MLCLTMIAQCQIWEKEIPFCATRFAVIWNNYQNNTLIHKTQCCQFSVFQLLKFCIKGTISAETPLQSRQPWIYHISNCNKLGEHGFQCVSINKWDTDICHLKGALSKYDHHFAIKGRFNCENHDLKMCKISKIEQLPILQIIHLISMIGLK